MDPSRAGRVGPPDELRQLAAVPVRAADLADASIVDRDQHDGAARRMAPQLVAGDLHRVLERLADLQNAEDEADQQREQERFDWSSREYAFHR